VRVRLAIAASLLIAAASVALSAASFTATTPNPGNTFTAAASFCSGGSQTVNPSQDAYVGEADAKNNFGTEKDLLVQSGDASNRRTLVQFDLPSTPKFCSVTAATLRLYAVSAASDRTIQALQVDASWKETDVTWDNQPKTTGSAASSPSGKGLGTWDVTSQVQAMYSGTNDGFLLQDSSEGDKTAQQQEYQSGEGGPDSQDPELVVSFG
jgi:large repetitive protein